MKSNDTELELAHEAIEHDQISLVDAMIGAEHLDEYGEPEHPYYVRVSHKDEAGGDTTTVFSADSLAVAIEVLYAHANTLHGMSYPTFAENEMHSAAIFTGDAWRGGVEDVRAEDCGYGETVTA